LSLCGQSDANVKMWRFESAEMKAVGTRRKERQTAG
jgi:hypothetical protein